jgi:hypothetical protein
MPRCNGCKQEVEDLSYQLVHTHRWKCMVCLHVYNRLKYQVKVQKRSEWFADLSSDQKQDLFSAFKEKHEANEHLGWDLMLFNAVAAPMQALGDIAMAAEAVAPQAQGNIAVAAPMQALGNIAVAAPLQALGNIAVASEAVQAVAPLVAAQAAPLQALGNIVVAAQAVAPPRPRQPLDNIAVPAEADAELDDSSSESDEDDEDDEDDKQPMQTEQAMPPDSGGAASSGAASSGGAAPRPPAPVRAMVDEAATAGWEILKMTVVYRRLHR